MHHPVFLVETARKHILIHKEAEEAHSSGGHDQLARIPAEGLLQHPGQAHQCSQFKIVAHAAKHVGAGLGAQAHKCQADNAHMHHKMLHSAAAVEHPPHKHKAQQRRHNIHRQPQQIHGVIVKHFSLIQAFAKLIGLIHKFTDHILEVVQHQHQDNHNQVGELLPGPLGKDGQHQKYDGVGMDQHSHKNSGKIPDPAPLFDIRDRQGDHSHRTDLFDRTHTEAEGTQCEIQKNREGKMLAVALKEAQETDLGKHRCGKYHHLSIIPDASQEAQITIEQRVLKNAQILGVRQKIHQQGHFSETGNIVPGIIVRSAQAGKQRQRHHQQDKGGIPACTICMPGSHYGPGIFFRFVRQKQGDGKYDQ